MGTTQTVLPLLLNDSSAFGEGMPPQCAISPSNGESQNTLVVSHAPASSADPLRIGMMAGMAIAVTVGTVATAVNDTPQYEGRFQIAVEPAATTHQDTSFRADQNLALKDAATKMRVLESQLVLNPVVEQLREQQIDIDYTTLSRNLHVSVAHNQLRVRYRDADPKRVQQVLEHLSQAYLSYGQTCHSGACRGIAYIETQLPGIQQRVDKLRQDIRQFHQRHGFNNVEARSKLLSDRSADIQRQMLDLKVRTAEARTRYQTLQQRLALKPGEAIAPTLLKQDLRYQTLFLQYQQLEAQIATEAKRILGNPDALRLLHEQHQMVLQQLNSEAQQVLSRYISRPGADLNDPIYQEPALLNVLHQSIQTVHYLQILQTRQQTLTQTNEAIDQQKIRLASLLRRYAHLRHELHISTDTLQEYIDRLTVLKTQASEEQLSWQLTAPPNVLLNQDGQPVNVAHPFQQHWGTSLGLGALLGLGLAALLHQRRQSRQRLVSSTVRLTLAPGTAIAPLENAYAIPQPVNSALTKRWLRKVVTSRVQVGVRAS